MISAMTPRKRSIGELVEALRIEAGLSIRQLAAAADVNPANISRLERGEAPRPQPATLARLAEALGADLEQLYAAAGIVPERDLPSFVPYLRTRYGHLPPDKLEELNATFERIAADYESSPRTKVKQPKGGRHVTH